MGRPTGAEVERYRSDAGARGGAPWGARAGVAAGARSTPSTPSPRGRIPPVPPARLCRFADSPPASPAALTCARRRPPARRSTRREAWAAIRLLRSRERAAHRATVAHWQSIRADFRALLPAAHRQRHQETRAAARPTPRPARDERPRCGARCRDGRPCAAAVVWPAGDDVPRRRCRLHGGLSTGPRTTEGRRRALQNLRNVRPPPPSPPPTQLHLAAPVGCAACVLSARRGRGAVHWYTRQVRAAGGVTRWVLSRALRWARCAEHARHQLARWDREGGLGVTLTVSFVTPCA